MRAWLRENKIWFVIAPLCILFTLGLLGTFRLIFGDSAMFGVRMELPENATPAERAGVEHAVINATVIVVGITVAIIVASMMVSHFRRSRK